ncbi:ATP-binding protein [Tahibacter amnicola]|uniref:histidine kinase n=1 Tax=Tahibacter amnicola TaxID=2976241 RepID=A0ABY6BMR9_9GAMM|nr:ATP-binding protein [Tahibacter amnicola]UXI69866.1 ATP-binding protein [Tahibacter amnicola]
MTLVDEVPLVKADEMRLAQVLVNLLINAAHAIRPGQVDINTITVSAGCNASGQIVITITDSGCGMSASVLERIYEPFFTTKAVGAGTGLGLSTCLGIVRSMGGELLIESVPGEGTTARVVLQAAQIEATSPAIAEPAVRSQRGRILVVDDEIGVLQSLRHVLSDHDLVCVESAQAAIDAIESDGEFDAVVCDLVMPAMTGQDLFRKAQSRWPHLSHRFIFITGGAITADMNRFLDAVPNTVIHKPFRDNSLKTAVSEVIRRADLPGTT